MNLSDSIAFYRIFLCVSLTLGTQLPMDESLRIRCGVSLQGRAANADDLADSFFVVFEFVCVFYGLVRGKIRESTEAAVSCCSDGLSTEFAEARCVFLYEFFEG